MIGVIIGIILVIASFLFMLYNMAGFIDHDRDFKQHMRHHLAGMAVFVLGASITVGSAMWTGIEFTIRALEANGWQVP